VNHFRAGVLVLAVIGQRDGKPFAARLAALQDDARIFHGEPRTDVAIDPFDLGIFVGESAFGDQIENIGRPVLHGDVLDFGALLSATSSTTALCRVVVSNFGAVQPSNVSDFAAFVRNDEGALELAEISALIRK